ncbi:hypothetical protein HKD37_08G022408 [Glycine soja]
MAEIMHSKSNINRIKEAIAKLTSTQFHLTATQNSMATKLNDLLLKMAQLETSQHSPTSSTVNQHIVSPSPNPHRMKLEICREIQALQPLTLVQVTGLTRLQEEKFCDFRRSPCDKPTSLSLSAPHYALVVNQHPSSLLLPSPPKPPSILIKRLSPEKLATRRKKALFFNCDEKYHRGHTCASKVFLLIAEEADKSQVDHVLLDPPPDKNYLSPRG